MNNASGGAATYEMHLPGRNGAYLNQVRTIAFGGRVGKVYWPD